MPSPLERRAGWVWIVAGVAAVVIVVGKMMGWWW